MRQSGNGALSSVRLTPMACAIGLLARATNGTWMRCSSRSMAAFITFGVPWIRMATCWISWFRAGGTRRQQRSSFARYLKGLRYVPRMIITDKLRSYSAAKAEVMPSVEHLQQKYKNNRAENSHQPTRFRERVMRRFKSAGHAQRFLSAFGIITSHFRVGRHLYSASGYRTVMKSRFGFWEEAICVEAMVN
jgi:hypothetical protein